MSARSTRTAPPGAGAVGDAPIPPPKPTDDRAATPYADAHVAGRAGSGAAYFYAVVRVVPNVERGERFNAGVVLFSRSLRFLGMRTALDHRKLAALAPGCDPEPITRQLDALRAVADGVQEGGPIARLDRAERFYWLSSPGSTMIQPSPVHTGLTSDPEATLDRLFRALVLG